MGQRYLGARQQAGQLVEPREQRWASPGAVDQQQVEQLVLPRVEQLVLPRAEQLVLPRVEQLVLPRVEQQVEQRAELREQRWAAPGAELLQGVPQRVPRPELPLVVGPVEKPAKPRLREPPRAVRSQQPPFHHRPPPQ
jgi:hypothetical protein